MIWGNIYLNSLNGEIIYCAKIKCAQNISFKNSAKISLHENGKRVTHFFALIKLFFNKKKRYIYIDF